MKKSDYFFVAGLILQLVGVVVAFLLKMASGQPNSSALPPGWFWAVILIMAGTALVVYAFGQSPAKRK